MPNLTLSITVIVGVWNGLLISVYSLFFFAICIIFFIWLTKKRPAKQNERYKNSPLSKEDSRAYFRKLLSVIHESKPYLDNAISLSKLAGMLEIKPHTLSQVINDNSGMNFFEFINSYRIEEIKKRFADHDFTNHKIAAIAYECGFNSISSFNTAFKKIEKISPGEYRSKFASNNGSESSFTTPTL